MTNKQTIDLYTTKDVAAVRGKLLKAQKQIDPILCSTIAVGDACLDHNHITQECRGVLDRQTNAFEGLVFNAFKRCLSWKTEEGLPVILRRLADYLESTPSVLAHHPDWIKRVLIDFKKLPASKQGEVLNYFTITPTGNLKERCKQLRKLILSRNSNYIEIAGVINDKRPR